MAQPPRVNRSIDIKTLPLRPEEAFVFSRVDGQALPKEIALTTGMSTAQVEQALDRLSELGALEGWRAQRAQTPARTQTDERFHVQADKHEEPAPRRGRNQLEPTEDGFVVVPDLDLTAAEQQRVWKLWKRLSQSNHYEVLGLPRDTTREQIKAAYFEQVSAFHPDKHFGKTLGTYKEKLEAVFQRLTQAHDTLSRTRRREQYDATLPPPLAQEEITAKPVDTGRGPEPSEKPEKTSSGDAARVPPIPNTTFTRSVTDLKAPASTPSATQQSPAPVSSPAASARPKLQSSPAAEGSLPPVSVDQRRQMAIRSLERGMRSMPGGDRPRPSVPSQRSPSGAPPPSSRSLLLDRARAAERDGEFENAAACYEKAAAAHRDATLFAKAAECLEQVATNASSNPSALWKRAADSARQAVQLSPANAQLRLLLSRIYAGAGMRASATREAEKAQELSPSEKSVQSWLERLRRGDV